MKDLFRGVCIHMGDCQGHIDRAVNVPKTKKEKLEQVFKKKAVLLECASRASARQRQAAESA